MDYMKILKNHNLKITPQRLEIVDILYKNGHITIDDLYQLLKERFPSLSLATVYKNINMMCDKLVVSEVKIPNKKSLYELNRDEHSHILCLKCNAISDIDLNKSNLLKEAEEISGYKIYQTSILFSGLCPKCLKEIN